MVHIYYILVLKAGCKSVYQFVIIKYNLTLEDKSGNCTDMFTIKGQDIKEGF